MPERRIYLHSSTACRQSAKEVYLDSIDPSQIPLLTYLPQLTTVVVRGGGQMDGLSQLQEYCHENGLDFCISIGGQRISDSAKEITISGADDDSLNLLSLLPELESVYLVLPECEHRKSGTGERGYGLFPRQRPGIPGRVRH